FNKITFLEIVLICLIIRLMVLLLIVSVKQADKYGRNSLFWLLVALIYTPFLSVLLLHLLRETDEKRKERMKAEERLKNIWKTPITVNDKSSARDMENWLTNNPEKTISDYIREK